MAPPADVLTPWPGLADPDHILRTVETFHHPVGSCRMGRPDDPGAAVDAAGRVFGLEGLWVMDASVFARVPSANTHLAVIALAERLAAASPAGGPGAARPAPARHNRGSRAPRSAGARKCQNPGRRPERTRCPSSHRPPRRTPRYTAVIETSAGEIRLELWPEAAPQTVGNFVGLAREGFYDGTVFHRVIRDFMIQGGCPKGTGTGGPGYDFADEINDRKLVKGTLAMANAGPNTNGSQFFIVTAEATPWLDGAHTGFGRVVGGEEVVEAIGTTATGPGDRPREEQRVSAIRIEEG